jgi:hypothetical protein
VAALIRFFGLTYAIAWLLWLAASLIRACTIDASGIN